jgi:hypothetical protein
MPFIPVREAKPESNTVSITFERRVLDELDLYQRFTGRKSRSEVVNDIIREVFKSDADFVANKPATQTRRKKGKSNGSGTISPDGQGTGSEEARQ